MKGSVSIARRERDGLGVRRGRGDLSSTVAGILQSTYKAWPRWPQVLHRRQSAGRYGGCLIGLLRPGSILRFCDASVCEAKRGGRYYVSLATNPLSACALSAWREIRPPRDAATSEIKREENRGEREIEKAGTVGA